MYWDDLEAMLEWTGIYWAMLEYTGVYWDELGGYARVGWNVLDYTGMF